MSETSDPETGDKAAQPEPSSKPAAGDADRGDTAGAGKPREIGGPKGPEPTRYGDWEVGGRCSDF